MKVVLPVKGRGILNVGPVFAKTVNLGGEVKCSNCQSGKVSCSICIGGKAPCTHCNATGEIIRKGWIFTHRDICLLCGGARNILCQKCKGSTSTACSLCKGTGAVMCSSCQGKGRLAKCDQCSGTQKVPCQDCNQQGKVEGQWIKSLSSLPVDRLHEKRQREISNIHMEISRLAQLEDTIYQDVIRGHGGAEQGAEVSRQQGVLRRSIGELQSEMKAIEQVLESKWK
jgi:RecJ-like exonuclease